MTVHLNSLAMQRLETGWNGLLETLERRLAKAHDLKCDWLLFD